MRFLRTPKKGDIQGGEVVWRGLKRGLYPGDEADFAELEGIRLCAYWDAKSNQSWRLPFHRNEGLEIGFVSNGSSIFPPTKLKTNLQRSRQSMSQSQSHGRNTP